MSRTVTCPACGEESAVIYRCSECGRDLVNVDATTGGEAAIGTASGGDE